MRLRLAAVVLSLACHCLCLSAAQSAEKTLYQTSFETLPAGAFTGISSGPVMMRVQGKAAVTAKFASDGKQSLQLAGGETTTLAISTTALKQPVRGLTFKAERWTNRAPFECHVDILSSGQWQTLVKLDQVIAVGARFLSDIRLAIPNDAKPTMIRIRVVSPKDSGILLDELALLAEPPANPTRLPAPPPTRRIALLHSESLFVSGTNDTHTFRIPAIDTAVNGDLIAACDARRKNDADLVHQRTIDIVYRRSTDNGKTWTPMQVMDPVTDGGCSDPSLIVDRETGAIFCFYNYLPVNKANREYRFYVQKSTDNGQTWQAPQDITDQVAGPELKNAFKFITSGRGIQTRDGRLLHNYVRVGRGLTVFCSDDHGESWHALSDCAPADESKLVQLHDDSLMINCRWQPGKRVIHRSDAKGLKWDTENDLSLIDPRCNACIIQYTAKQDGFSKNRLLFCNAASNNGRKNLAVRISYDVGKTWSEGGVIDPGASAYSEITVLHDGTVGVLYEPGYGEVKFVRFDLPAITADQDKLQKPWQP